MQETAGYLQKCVMARRTNMQTDGHVNMVHVLCINMRTQACPNNFTNKTADELYLYCEMFL